MNKIAEMNKPQEMLSPVPKGGANTKYYTGDPWLQRMANATPKPTVNPTVRPAPQPTPQATPRPMAAPQASPLSGYLTGRNPKARTSDPVVIGAITQAANKYGVPKEFLTDLFFSESSFNPKSANTTPEGIAADVPVGLAQFRPGTWNEVMRYASDPKSSAYGVLTKDMKRDDPYANALAAAYLIKQGQLGKWDASMWNWGQYWPQEELSKYGFYDQTMSRKRNKSK